MIVMKEVVINIVSSLSSHFPLHFEKAVFSLTVVTLERHSRKSSIWINSYDSCYEKHYKEIYDRCRI